MIDLTSLTLYTLGACAIVITPGADFLYVSTRGMAHGPRAGLFSALGISVGLILHTALASLGLTALINASAIVFNLIRFVGAGYLVYLGVGAFFPHRDIASSVSTGRMTSGAIFRQAVMTNLFNPKALLTFLAFIPQFLQPRAGSLSIQIMAMGLIIAAIAVIWFGFIGLIAGSLGDWFARQPRLTQGIRWSTGCIMIGLGAQLILSK